jgi:uncharacterized protein (TIGR02145 family)
METKIAFVAFAVILLVGTLKAQNPTDTMRVVYGIPDWISKNLDVVTFANGDTIREAQSNEDWRKAADNQVPAWCYYDNDPANGTIFGKLYNWYAIRDPRRLAPKGWHIPTDYEWNSMKRYLGEEMTVETPVKGRYAWECIYEANNSTKFAGVPSGFRTAFGAFHGGGHRGYWWGSPAKKDLAPLRTVPVMPLGRVGTARQRLAEQDKCYGCGFSVRCIRD